ncbi:hypothetical protein D3C87_1409000 [compost metagenome]
MKIINTGEMNTQNLSVKGYNSSPEAINISIIGGIRTNALVLKYFNNTYKPTKKNVIPINGIFNTILIDWLSEIELKFHNRPSG